MTHQAQDASVASGQRVYLLEFTIGASITRLAASMDDYTDATVSPAQVYTATPGIDYTEVGTQDRPENENFAITFPIDNTFAQSLRGVSYEPIGVAIKSVHLTDPDAEIRVVQIGRVVGPGAYTSAEDGEEVIQLRCETLASKMRRRVMSILMEPQCQYAVYSEQCGVDIAAFTDNVTVLSGSADGTQFTINAIPGGRVAADYVGGVLTYDGQRRWIKSVSGTTFTLFDTFVDLTLAIGSPLPTIGIAPGCDQSRETCNDRFANILDNLGFYWLPNKEAFIGAIF